MPNIPIQRTIEFIALNLFGLGCSVIAIAVVVWMRYFRTPQVSRVSLSLQAAISVVDMVRHVRLLFTSSDDLDVCNFMGFLLFFGEHLNMLLNVAIAANLHRMLHYGSPPGKKWFKLLWVLPPAIAFCVDFIPLALDVYGQKDYICFIKEFATLRVVFRAILLYLTTYTGVMYCLVISIWVFCRRPRSHAPEVFDLRYPLLEPSKTPIADRFSKRIALYPLSCFISNLGFILVALSFDITGASSPKLVAFAFYLQSLTGVFNLICLLFDPSFRDISQEINYPIASADLKRGLKKSDLWSEFDREPMESVLMLPCTEPTTMEEAYRFRDDLRNLDSYLDHL